MGKLTDVELRNWVKAGQPVAKSDGDGLTLTKARETAAGQRVAVSQGVDVALAKQYQKEADKLAAKFAKSGTVKALYDEWFSRDIERRPLGR